MNFDLLILFSATTQFKLQPVNKNNVEGIKGKTLSLEWKFSGLQENHVIVNSALYFNVTKPALEALICNSWLNSITQVIPLFPFVTTRSRNLFGDRISVSYKSNTYNFTLTNLQYNNTGPYFLQVAVGSTNGSRGITVKNSTIRICNIKGKIYLLLLFVFPCQCILTKF